MNAKLKYTALLIPLFLQGVLRAEGIEGVVVKAGRIEPQLQTFVPARVGGQVAKVEVKVGQPIRKGDIVAVLENEESRRRMQSAKLNLKRAEKRAAADEDLQFLKESLRQAKTQLSRFEMLVKTNVVTRQELEEQQLEVAAIEASIEQSKKDFESAQIEVASQKVAYEQAQRAHDDNTIRAPISGTVGHVFSRPGEWLQPGQSFVRIDNDQQTRISFQVPAKHWRKSWLNTGVRLGGSEFEGRVTNVNHRFVSLTGMISFSVTFNDQSGKLTELDNQLTLLDGNAMQRQQGNVNEQLVVR